MDISTLLRKKVGQLNNQGGFAGALIYDKIVEAAQGVDPEKVLEVLDQVQQKQATIKDPNAWVCAGLRKRAAGRSVASAAGAGHEDLSVLQQRVEWLNTAGGFQDALLIDKILDAAEGVDISEAMRILGELEEKRETVRDPLAFVTHAMRRFANNTGLQRAIGLRGGTAKDVDQELRKQVGFLNKEGGFAGALIYDKLAAAAAGLDVSEVRHVLDQLSQKQGQIKDPTAWTAKAFRGRGGGRGGMVVGVDMMGGMAGMRMGGAIGMGRPMGGAMMLPSTYAQTSGGFYAPAFVSMMPTRMGAPLSPEVDQKLRSRIGWLNGDGGGFGGQVKYRQIAEVAGGVDPPVVFSILKELEEKKDQIKDPTAYVVVALRKKAMIADCMDVRTDAALRKRVGRLNNAGGFEGALNYQKIKDAAAGAPPAKLMTVLEELEGKRETVNDPTAYVCSALRKAAARGAPIMMTKRGIAPTLMTTPIGGVKRTIAKAR